MAGVYDYEETFEELAATVAHEIKNPLSLALANVYLMKKADKERNFVQFSGAIESELQRIDELLVDFLQTAKGEYRMEPIELYTFMLPLVERYQNAPGKNGCEPVPITLEMPSRPMLITGDTKKLCIVVNNLIKNALEAVDEAGFISISFEEMETEIKVRFHDNGCGLPGTPGEWQSTKEGGSGMGLSICRRIITGHSGSFTISNNPDQGTTAIVTLRKEEASR